MAEWTDEDVFTFGDDLGPKRKGGKIPVRPGRDAPHSLWKRWLSLAGGLPEEVTVQSVERGGVDDADPLTIVLSNGMKMRCSHQKRLQMPASLQAWFASASKGIAQPQRLNQAEAGDVYVALCVLGTLPGDLADPAADLREHLAAFIAIGQTATWPLDHEHRYDTIQKARRRPPFDRSAALDMRNGVPDSPPIIVVDPPKRYVRASEWINYLRHVIGQTVDPSALVGRMAEIGSERFQPQAWNADRSHKAELVFYALPDGL